MKLMKKRENAFRANLFVSHKYRKGLCVLLSFWLLLLPLMSCGDGNIDQSEAETTTQSYILPQQSIKIGYTSSDSLNPFFAETSLNVSLCSFAFSPLYKLDNTFSPVPEIASFYTYASKELKVSIQTGLYFSDGSNVSESDVVYSFNKAKSSPLYMEKLENFESARGAGDYEVSFTLSKDDSLAVNLLDFPIVKNNSAESDADVPTGCGLYMYRLSGDSVSLIHNKYSALPRPEIGTIELVNIEDSSVLAYSLETGLIDAYYTDLNGAKLARAYASLSPVYLNNFVYVGLNTDNFALSFSTLRAAISLSANRADICGSAYQGNAVPAYTPFNPSWSVFTVSSIDTSAFALNYSEAIKILEELGYTSFTSDTTRSGDKGILSFKLIVNIENEYKTEAARVFAESLKKVGININVHALNWEDYMHALEVKDYDMYMGEVKIPSNMDLSALFSSGGNAAYGINPDGRTATAFPEYLGGTISIETFNAEFQAEMPLIPLCYRNGLLIVRKEIKTDIISWPGNIYENIHEWSVGGSEQETATAAQTTESDIVI